MTDILFLHKLTDQVKRYFKKEIIIGIDVDGVLRDFIGQVRYVYKKTYPRHKIKDQLGWDLTSVFPIKEKINDFIYKEHVIDIFGYAPMYSGAREFLKKLRNDFKCQLKFVTTQPNVMSKIYTNRWLLWEGCASEPKEIIFSDRKGNEKIDILIDDGVHNLLDADRKGKFCICFNQPWNIQDVKWKGLRANNYDEVYNIIEKNYSKYKKVYQLRNNGN